MKIRGYLTFSERRNLAVALAGLSVFLMTVVPGFTQGATDVLPSTGQPKNQVVATIPVGAWPSAVVVNGNSTLVYVANTVSQSVSVIYAATNTVATTISSVGYNPIAIAITPDSNTLYVGNATPLGDLVVSVVDTPTNTVIKTIDLGSLGMAFSGLQIAVSPDGKKAYVATGYPGKGVAVIDTATNLVSGTIKINDGRVWGAPAPNGVAFSSSGRVAYVTSAGNRSSGQVRCFVSNIDSASERQIDATGPLRNSGLGGEVNIHGRMLYIASYTDTDVVVFDTRSKTVVKSVPVGGYVESEALTPEGKYLYVTYSPAYSSDKVATFDTATSKSVGSPLQVGQGASGLAVAPNGLYAYVTNSVDDTVSVIDISIQ
jgi:YVTN family beta-propeller protein